MADIVEVSFKGGTLLFAAAGSSGPEAFSGASVAAKATETFEDILDSVRRLGETMAEKLKGLEFATAEASFGIAFTGKGKFIVAEAAAEASVAIKLIFNG